MDRLSEGYGDLVQRLSGNGRLAALARRAGVDAVLASDDPDLHGLRKANRELVTAAERQAERVMAHAIRARHPRHAVAGEEHGRRGAGQTRGVVTHEVEFDSSEVHRGYAAKFGPSHALEEEEEDKAQTMDAITRLARPEILTMKPYSSARTEGKQHSIAIFLDANENPYPPFPADPACEGLNRYPEPQPQHLLDLFAAHYWVDREQLLITRGADEAIDLLVRAFCAAGSDAIVIHTPTFGMYEISAQIQGAAVHAVPLRQQDGFQLDVDAILRVCRDYPACKLVFVCSPNNPTGALLRRDDILRLCAKLLGHSLVVADETYTEFTDQPSLCSEVATHPNLVVLRTLSKEYSLAGERCGTTIAHPEVVGIISRILAPYPLTASAIRAVTRAMTPEGVERARANMRLLVEQRKLLEKALWASPAVTRVHPSDTNYLLIQTPAPELLLSMMQRAGIKLRDRSKVPGIEGCVRLTVGTPEQNGLVLEVFQEYATRLPASSGGPGAAHRSGL